RLVVRDLAENGRVSRVHDLTQRLVGIDAAAVHKPHIAFVSELSPRLTVVTENDNYHHAVGIAEHGDEKAIKSRVDEVVKTIKAHKEPVHIDTLHAQTDYEHPTHVSGLASVS